MSGEVSNCQSLGGVEEQRTNGEEDSCVEEVDWKASMAVTKMRSHRFHEIGGLALLPFASNRSLIAPRPRGAEP